MLRVSLLDKTHSSEFAEVFRVFLSNGLEEDSVDVEDDLHVSREEMGEKRNAPFLERFDHDGAAQMKESLVSEYDSQMESVEA